MGVVHDVQWINVQQIPIRFSECTCPIEQVDSPVIRDWIHVICVTVAMSDVRTFGRVAEAECYLVPVSGRSSCADEYMLGELPG